MRSKPANSSNDSQPNPNQQGATGRLRSMLRRLIIGDGVPEKTRRVGLRLESLEQRQMLAGDVDLLVTDAGNVANETFANDESLLVDTLQAEGELRNDLVAFAKALDDAGVQFFGANWCPQCTLQKELFEDGADHLPFLEVTGPDRSPNALGNSEQVFVYPTWEFPDGSREEGVLSLATISTRSGVTIPQSEDPTFNTVGNQTVAIGSPLHIPIDVYDPDGGAQTVTITVADPGVVEATVLSGNRSIRIDMTGHEDMVFELFEQRAPDATGRVIGLAQDGFYDGILFHRVVDDFVIQGGDPTSTGSGGSTLGDFDDDFHPDLQHNQVGVLSFAKSSDDTNDSQFFITEVPTRFLDFNHSVFGQLVEGDKAREAISEHEVNGSDRPTTDIAIESITVFDDIENSVIMLKAAGGTGSTTATITVTDPDGNSHSETITIDVVADVVNGQQVNSQPFLGDITLPASFEAGQVAEVQLSSIDIEGDAVTYVAAAQSSDTSVLIDAVTGLLQVQPAAGFTGTADVIVGVQPGTGVTGNGASDRDTQLITLNFEATTQPLDPPESIDLLAQSDTGVSNTDNITNAGALTFLIDKVVSGAFVEIIDVDSGNVFGQTTAVGNSITITTNNFAAQPDGDYSVVARQTFNGQVSNISPSVTFTYDSTEPASVADTANRSAAVNQPYEGNLISPEEGSGLSYAISSGPTGASIDASTGVIAWTPTDQQTGTNSFTVTLTDLAGNVRTDAFDVEVVDPLAEVKLQLVDADGNEVTSVQVGDRFFLNFIGVDQRNAFERGGVFAAYADILFDQDIVRPVSGTVIQYPDGISSTGRSGAISAGLINELGAINFQTESTNLAETLLATVEMEAVGVGSVNILSEPADVLGNDVLLYNLDDAIDNSRIIFGSASLAVGQSFVVTDDTFTVDEDSAATTFDVLLNDSVVSGNGTLSVVGVTQPASGGSVTLQNGIVQFTPAADFAGTANFTYRVSDANGVQEDANVTVTVNNVNDPPTGVADSFTVDANSVDNLLDVLANDSISPDTGETLSISVVLPAATSGATVSITDDGQNVIYTPEAGFTGADSLTYRVSDGTESVEVQVNITVSPADDPPTAVDDSFTIDEDDAEATFDVTGNDTTDAEGQTFVITTVGDPATAAPPVLVQTVRSSFISQPQTSLVTKRFRTRFKTPEAGSQLARLRLR